MNKYMVYFVYYQQKTDTYLRDYYHIESDPASAKAYWEALTKALLGVRHTVPLRQQKHTQGYCLESFSYLIPKRIGDDSGNVELGMELWFMPYPRWQLGLQKPVIGGKDPW